MAALVPSVTSCSSDRNPFEKEIPTTVKNAVIQLRLNVEDTRAGENSTAEEKAIKKLTIHVFNDKQLLEATKTATIGDGVNTVNIEVSHGLKTLYVVSAQSNVNPAVSTHISDYENSTFNSSLDNIKTENGFVMVGKSKEQYVRANQSLEDLPSSNIFDIKLVRLVAKAQVKASNVDGSAFGIKFEGCSFKPFQLNERMIVLHNGSDVLDTYEDKNNNGTYDYYTLGVGDYLAAVTDDFKAEGCAYLSENIVNKPLSGNTTFLSVRFATTPNKYYTFDSTDSSLKITEETPAPSTTYYAVGIHDRKNGIVDYVLDHANKHVVTFKDKSDAENYMNSLNSQASPANKMAQNKGPHYASDVTEGSDNSLKYEVMTFEGGNAYYRINISHEETSGDKTVNKVKVKRNNFYKVNINSVSGLGFSKDSSLCPTNPETELDSEGNSFISVMITVADWDEVKQEENLR